ncbi:hypothetical protein QYF61_022845 [Mycteria americana]|uniref:Uncharacterized protein n=1 Tax=Mycteria americana TaxID=33587 RepID=A0AAN7N6I6_MYCAM|nr:hypothetical protein QYF61_022845 [Mycteria americana]
MSKSLVQSGCTRALIFTPVNSSDDFHSKETLRNVLCNAFRNMLKLATNVGKGQAKADVWSSSRALVLDDLDGAGCSWSDETSEEVFPREFPYEQFPDLLHVSSPRGFQPRFGDHIHWRTLEDGKKEAAARRGWGSGVHTVTGCLVLGGNHSVIALSSGTPHRTVSLCQTCPAAS